MIIRELRGSRSDPIDILSGHDAFDKLERHELDMNKHHTSKLSIRLILLNFDSIIDFIGILYNIMWLNFRVILWPEKGRNL